MSSDDDILTDVLTGLTPTSTRNRIWAADDNADVRLLLHRAFKRCDTGLPVEFFPNGFALVEKARQQGVAPKVLLLDVEMPRLSGLQALDTLAGEGFLSGTTVIIFSTVLEDACVKAAYESGASFYVRKPIGGQEYRQLARLCTACVYMRFGHEPSRAKAFTVEEALAVAAENSALS